MCLKSKTGGGSFVHHYGLLRVSPLRIMLIVVKEKHKISFSFETLISWQ
jgi:hypothetical protein